MNIEEPMTEDQLRPRRTHRSNKVYRLPGGNEDNDLWVEMADDLHGDTVIASTWVPTPAQRQRIADGENVELIIWGSAQPPVAMAVTDVPVGKKAATG